MTEINMFAGTFGRVDSDTHSSMAGRVIVKANGSPRGILTFKCPIIRLNELRMAPCMRTVALPKLEIYEYMTTHGIQMSRRK